MKLNSENNSQVVSEENISQNSEDVKLNSKQRSTKTLLEIQEFTAKLNKSRESEDNDSSEDGTSDDGFSDDEFGEDEDEGVYHHH
jgi:hypothetical protein